MHYFMFSNRNTLGAHTLFYSINWTIKNNYNFEYLKLSSSIQIFIKLNVYILIASTSTVQKKLLQLIYVNGIFEELKKNWCLEIIKVNSVWK